MSFKTLFDIGSENFDYYFFNQLQNISPKAKDELPRDISFKLFRGGGKVNATNSSKLNVVSKIFILWKCLKKKWWLFVEDEENGMSTEEFIKLREAAKKRDYSSEKASSLISSGTFVLASKELATNLSYLNYLSNSPAYNYISKNKNKVENKADEWNDRMTYIVKFFRWYEANKKVWVSQYGISIPEWYVLLYLYDGREVFGSPIHKEFYRRTYQSSPTKIKRCFGVLQTKGLISKTGDGRGAKLRITALGVDRVNTILTNYALNC
jgi:hypothetical protein